MTRADAVTPQPYVEQSLRKRYCVNQLHLESRAARFSPVAEKIQPTENKVLVGMLGLQKDKL